MTTNLLRMPEVLKRTGLCRSALYQLIATGDFPTQIRLTPRSVAWLESEVEGWIEARIAATRSHEQQGTHYFAPPV